MTIENKELYDLYRKLFKSGRIDCVSYGASGLFLEGFDGGINAYITDGRAIYRKTFHGDNKYEFVNYYDSWYNKDGITNIVVQHDDYDTGKYNRLVKETKGFFENEKFYVNTVDYKEFKKAVKCVDAINRGDKTHDIVLSLNEGKFDLASWNICGSVSSQLEGNYSGSGAVCVTKKYLDGIKADKTLELSFSDSDKSIVLNIHGDIDAVIMTKTVEDKAEFKYVLEYEYHKPEKPVIIEKPVETVIEQKPELKPVDKPELKLVKSKKTVKRQARKVDWTERGWTYDPVKLKWSKVCNW